MSFIHSRGWKGQHFFFPFFLFFIFDGLCNRYTVTKNNEGKPTYQQKEKKEKKKKKEEEKEIKKQSCSVFGLCKATSTARSQAFIGHFFYCFYLVIPDYIIVYWRVEGREVGILFGPIW